MASTAPEGPILAVAEHETADVTEIVAQGIGRIRPATPVVRLAMQINSEPTDIGLEGGKGAVAERTADRHTGLAACSEEHRAVRIAGQLGGSQRAHVARTHLR